MAGNLVVDSINGDDIAGGFLGVGQTWTAVAASRSSGVTYTNSTGKPIMVAISQSLSGGTITIGGVSRIFAAGGSVQPFVFIVPNGVTYKAIITSFITYWHELR